MLILFLEVLDSQFIKLNVSKSDFDKCSIFVLF